MMTEQQLKTLKKARILSQTIFLGLFVFIFIRSTDPFSNILNPFLRFDPLIFLTHLRLQLNIILPVIGLLLLTLILGRFFCGWVCPLGSLIDLFDFLFKRVRKLNLFSKVKIPSKRWLLYYPPSFIVLGGVLVTIFFKPPILQFFHPNVWLVRIFSLSNLGLFFLGLLTLFSIISRRFWCIYICPLGALYGIITKASIFKLSITECTQCGYCNSCPTEALQFEIKTVLHQQCILCFDFEYLCPAHGFKYGKLNREIDTSVDESRRSFLIHSSLIFGGLLFGTIPSLFDRTAKTNLIRPPGIVDEGKFVQRCLRCFQCVNSCPNDIIKITGLQAGFDSVFTPHLEFNEYGCDYYCQVCQEVCPNFAIPLQSLPEKQKSKIGLAFIDEELCVVFAEDTNCLVCEEFCPIPQKAIIVLEKKKQIKGKEMLLRYPKVVNDRCIGCGICEAKCPTSPKSITVSRI